MSVEDHLRGAYWLATFSKVPTTQVGALIVAKDGEYSSGVNDIHGVHAEVAAILRAGRLGSRTAGATMYAPWSACETCAQSILIAGITRLVRHKQIMDTPHPKWAESLEDGDHLLHEGGVEIVDHDGWLQASPILYQGDQWQG